LRNALLEAHAEIFDPAWWQSVQSALARGELADIPPYPASARIGR
jgi:isocitrate dehydrogenase kinase/phosphatase